MMSLLCLLTEMILIITALKTKDAMSYITDFFRQIMRILDFEIYEISIYFLISHIFTTLLFYSYPCKFKRCRLNLRVPNFLNGIV